jgi:uncharacterized membrane protein (UPF0127 family)
MGKRLVALSMVATLVAWPVMSQEAGPAGPAAGEAPPTVDVPVADAPEVQALPKDTPPKDAVANDAVTEDAVTEDAVTDAPLAEAPDIETPPVLDPILPIGDEPITIAGADPDTPPDPDNSIGACREDALYLRGDFGKIRFTVDVAKTAEDRAQGLMHVESMPTSKGMLFVYPAPQPVAFWMKNTLIPLDLIFADGRGVVVKVHDSAIPGDLTSIPGGDQVQFVLEINGGLARMLGIQEGAQMRHPAVRRAAWPC